MTARLQKGATDYHQFTTKRTSVKKRKELGVGNIWLNRVQCDTCKDILTSNNRHDYKTCSCGQVGVDGGSWYLRRIGSGGFTEMSEQYTYQDKQD